MLRGEKTVLTPVREADLPGFYEAHVDIRSRGAFFPMGVLSESTMRARFAETGFWERDEGTLLIRNHDGEMVGHIEFFPPVGYWDAFELSYQLYDPVHAGRGYTTEAVQLLVDYLFASKKQHRIQLVIAPGNVASKRIAEKCGFSYEGLVRGAFFNDGRNHDVELYGLVRTDPRPWHAGR